LGSPGDLLAASLDVTDPTSVQAAVDTAVERFGRIDVLVNNAGNFYAGFFEEIIPDDFRAQVETNLFGPRNVTRAVLPVMRTQRSGLIVTISSTAGLIGQEFCTAYAASKLALEGFMESLTPVVAPFGIPHDGGGARVLSHRPPHPGIDQLRRVLDRRDYTERARRRPSRPGTR
jgi:NAD(P)-dependent dehydrogenase (short-subunit alcohol dehydrogenase family)